MKVQRTGRAVVAGIVFLLTWIAISTHAAESFLIYSNGVLYAREIIDDGSGGFKLADTIDEISYWGDTSWAPVMGDIYGDGYDEFLIYKGHMFARRFIDDGAGGLTLGAADGIGEWGNADWKTRLGDIDGDGNDEAIMRIGATGSGRWGVTFINYLVDDGSGGLIFGGSDWLGDWGDSDWLHILGDIDGDDDDELLLYRVSDGLVFEKSLVDDGSGGLTFGASDNIGYWAGVNTNSVPLMGDIDGDGIDEFLLYDNVSGLIEAKELVSDGGGGYIFAAATDTIGTWGGTNFVPVMGNAGYEPPPTGTLLVIK